LLSPLTTATIAGKGVGECVIQSAACDRSLMGTAGWHGIVGDEFTKGLSDAAD
jgi:hypothetical protein